MNSLNKKLSLLLLTLFVVIGIILAFITRYASVQYNLEMTQRLNGSIAMYVAAEEQLIQNGIHNEAAINRLAQRAMVINPTVEVYLLDNQGNIISHNLPANTNIQQKVPLTNIHTFLQADSPRPLVNLDPRSPQSQKAFSAAKVTYQGQDEGYVYAILGGQAYETLANNLSQNFVIKIATASIIAVLMLGLFISLLVLNKLTKPLKSLTHDVRKFQQQITGVQALDMKPGDEIVALHQSFTQMSQKIEQQMHQIQQADQNRRDLITNVSHDLRTPLAAIQGYIDTIRIKKAQLAEADQEQYINTASKHCIRLNTLISELFELSKLDASAVKPDIEVFSMSELMQDVSMEFKIMAQQKNIDLKIDLLAGNTHVKADIALMQRVLENLIGNALKHTQKHGQVTLALKRSENGFKVVISDTGRGISKQELPYIFDRLYQAENSSKQNQSSSGLGLAIVKKILELHQTKITVTSQLKQGTHFSFQLPAAA